MLGADAGHRDPRRRARDRRAAAPHGHPRRSTSSAARARTSWCGCSVRPPGARCTGWPAPIDDRPVVASRETKSVSVEDTFEHRHLRPRCSSRPIIERMARTVSDRLRKSGLSGRTVTLKMRHHDFETHTRSSTLARPDRQRPRSWPTRRAGCWPATTSATACACSASASADWPTGCRTTCSPPTTTPPTRSTSDSVRAPVEQPTRPVVPGHGRPPRRSTATAGSGAPGSDGSRCGSRPGRPRRARAHVPRRRPGPRRGPHRYVSVMTAPDRPSRTRSDRGAPPRQPHPPRRRRSSTTTSGCATRTIPTTLAYLEAENAYTDAAHRAPRAAARADLRRDQGPHPRDRPVGAGPPRRAGGTTPAPSRASSTRSAAAAPIADPDDWTPPTLDAGSDRPRRGGAARLQRRGRRATSSSRSARSASATTATSWPGRSTPRATSATRSASRTCAPARCSPTRSRAPAAGPRGRPTARHLFYTTVDDAWRPVPRVAPRARAPPADDVLVFEEPDERYFVGVGRTQLRAATS